jgi:hypothetical protein
MCGRCVGFGKLEELRDYFPIGRSEVDVGNHNVGSSQKNCKIYWRK